MTDEQLSALEAAARAAMEASGSPEDTDTVWIDGQCWISVLVDAKCGREGDDYYKCHTMKATGRLRMRPAYRDHIAAANPAAVLALIQRVREAEGRALRIRWQDLGPSMTAHAFLGGMEVGMVHPHVNGGWCWAASKLPAEGHRNDKADAKAALETAVREAIEA